MSRLSRLLGSRIRGWRDGYHFSVFGLMGAGGTGRGIVHFMVLMLMSRSRIRLRYRVWDGIRLGLILRKIKCEWVGDIVQHGLFHVYVFRTWKPLYDSGGEEGNLTFRATIYRVTLIGNVEYQGYPSRIGHVV